MRDDDAFQWGSLAIALTTLVALALALNALGRHFDTGRDHLAQGYPLPGEPKAITLGVAKAVQRAAQWKSQELVDDIRDRLCADDRFAVGVTALLALLGGLTARRLRDHGRTYTAQLVGLPVVAGMSDLAENFFARAQLDLGVDLHASSVIPGEIATALKWTLLAASVVVLVHQSCRARGTPPRRGCPLLTTEEVHQRERCSVRARRVAAGLPVDEDSSCVVPVGLAFSGGGIRSATFNLGILQALARQRQLLHVDYLSTVSGGGYIGGALSSLLALARGSQIEAPSGKREPRFSTEPDRFPFNPEANERSDLSGFTGADEVAHLRTHGDFLIARRQFFSRELLRAIGAVTTGTLIHLAVFTIFLTGVAALVVAHVAWTTDRTPATLMDLEAPECPQPDACGEPTTAQRPAPLKSYVTALTANVLSEPSAIAGAATGAFVAAAVMAAGVALRIKRRRAGPSAESAGDGRTPEEIEEGAFLLWMVGLTVACVALVAARRRDAPADLHALLAPLAFCIAGFLVVALVHLVFESWHPRRSVVGRALGWLSDERTRRSRIAAAGGWFLYLGVGAVLLLVLPYALYRWGNLRTIPGGAKSGGVLALLLTRLLAARGGEGGGIGDAVGWAKKIARLAEPLRNAILGALVTGLVLVAVIGLGATIGAVTPTAGALGHYAFAVALLALAVFGVLGIVIDFNRISSHHFYRDRLAESYLETWARRRAPGAGGVGFEPARNQTDLRVAELPGGPDCTVAASAGDSANGAPYHLIVTALNLTSTHDLTRRDRKSDHFLFTPRYCGSKTTGYVPTDVYRNGETKLARAVGISGAATAPGMGRGTFFAQALAMTVTNVRLGQWMENPGYRGGRYARRQESGVFWPFYLLRELLGLSDARRRLVYLSDGGHTGDNLGIVPLLERRCGLIVACDAESDPSYHLGSLTNALRQIYVDENIKVDIDVAALRPRGDDDPEGEKPSSRSAEHFAIGRIRYPAVRDERGNETTPASTGWLLVLKASLTGDELARIDMYKRDHPDFPQHTTADQFFDDDEFEAFRELGYHIAKQVLGEMRPEAFRCETSEFQAHWQAFFATYGGKAATPTGFAIHRVTAARERADEAAQAT